MRMWANQAGLFTMLLVTALFLAGCGAPSDSPTYRNRHVDQQDPVYPAKPLGQEGQPYQGYEGRVNPDQIRQDSSQDTRDMSHMDHSSTPATPMASTSQGVVYSDANRAVTTPSALKDIHAAVAVLHPTAGNQARGTVRFTDTDGGVRVVANIEGLTPNQKHGFHVHEFGDCTAADATSAGGHYDPASTGHHDKPDATHRHAGDMGNLQADGQGKAQLELTLAGISITGNNAILGRGVIVHANPDDFGQPLGNAGGRIACGVIGVAGK